MATQTDSDAERSLSGKIESFLRQEGWVKKDEYSGLLKSLSEIQALARHLHSDNKSSKFILDRQSMPRVDLAMADARNVIDDESMMRRAKNTVHDIGTKSSDDNHAEAAEKSPGSDSSLSPAEIAEKMEKAGIQKVRMNTFSVFVLAVMAGAFISLGGIYYTFATSQTIVTTTFTQILGGLVFSTGLMFVVITGAEMFTSSTLSVVSLASKKITAAKLVKYWLVVYAGNIVGSIATVAILYMSKAWTSNNYQFGIRAIMIAAHKTSLGYVDAFFLGILCNCLVCLAIWLAASGKKVSDKILAIIFPVSAFVAIGFEHCVANMYFLTFAYVIKHNPPFLASLQKAGLATDISHLNIIGIVGNIVPVTLGNIVGGAIFVGFAYWLAYLRKNSKMQVS